MEPQINHGVLDQIVPHVETGTSLIILCVPRVSVWEGELLQPRGYRTGIQALPKGIRN
jgi:hypothetical protein